MTAKGDPEFLELKAFEIVISHKTLDNCACANDSAQRRRYDAV